MGAIVVHFAPTIFGAVQFIAVSNTSQSPESVIFRSSGSWHLQGYVMECHSQLDPFMPGPSKLLPPPPCLSTAIGFNVETVTYKNIKFQVWDLGGQTSIRPYWRCYYPNTQVSLVACVMQGPATDASGPTPHHMTGTPGSDCKLQHVQDSQ